MGRGTKQNKKVIYNNDSNEIKKLEIRLKTLQEKMKNAKLYNFEEWQLININADIRQTKYKLRRLKNRKEKINGR